MINQELINEVELNIKLIQDAPNSYTTDEDIIYEIEMATRRLLDLTRLIFAEGEVEYGLEVSRKGKDYARQILEYVSGMTMRELGDYMIAHPEMDRSQYDLYWDFVLEESFWDFESFMFYMEMNRPFAKKFYEPRMYTKSGKPALKLASKVLQDAGEHKYKLVAISMPSRVGKLISDETPVLTKDGWKNHGELKVGDYVVGLNGEWVQVTYVHPKNFANKRVRFQDGTYIDCHENHEWLLYDKNTQKVGVYETKYIQGNLKIENNTRNRFYLMPKKHLIGVKQDKLHVPPYVLGAWLGDGTTNKPTLTICDTDTSIVDKVKSYGYNVTSITNQVGCKCYSFDGLRADLKKLGMCQRNNAVQKFIPQEYLMADVSQRLELLAGLLDTDGTLIRKERRYRYSTISENLKDSIVELINSFGWRVSVTAYEPKISSSGIVGKHTVYSIGFNPNMEIPTVVERKHLTEFSNQKKIGVVAVEDIEPISGNCITVENSIYRVGRSFIPTHNSTIFIMFLCWNALRRPNSHSAYGGYSGVLAKGFYKEIMNMMTSAEYTYSLIYDRFHPAHVLIRDKSAEDLTVTLDEVDRFATVTCRGIDGSWTGIIDVSSDGVLAVDDLIRDRQHSLSPARMEETWQEYLNKMVDRKNVGAIEVLIGTLWGVLDPIERLRAMHEGDPEYCFLRIPALDDNDESNFDYEINGFTTEYYREMRSRLDDAEWQAKYQQRPYVREGLLFPKEEMVFFDGLVEVANVKRVYSVTDTAVGGGDNVSAPICYEMNDGRKLICKWIYDKRTVKHTVPRVINAYKEHSVSDARVERNGVGALWVDNAQKYIKEKNIVGIKLTPVSAPNRMSKEDKIKGYSDSVKQNYQFLAQETIKPEEIPDGFIFFERDADYNKAMADMSMYTSEGKNTCDDAPDSMAQLAIMDEKKKNGEIKPIHIPDGFGF